MAQRRRQRADVSQGPLIDTEYGLDDYLNIKYSLNRVIAT